MNWGRGAVLLGALVLACGHEPSPSTADLQETVVAQVDSESITVETLERVMRSQAVPAHSALELSLFDALCAKEARARGLDWRVGRSASHFYARAVFDAHAAAARELGEPTDTEVGQFVSANWIEVDRPEARVVLHAVVLSAEEDGSAADLKARNLAGEIRAGLGAAVTQVKSTAAPNYVPTLATTRYPTDPGADAFVRAVEAVDPQGLSVKVEQLPPIGTDGRAITPDRGSMDPLFVEGISKLAERGNLSEPIKSSFGYHVVLLLARLPSSQLTRKELVERFGADIVAARAGMELENTLTRLRRETPTEFDPAIDQALSLVIVREPR